MCDVQIKYIPVEKVLNNKQATKELKRLRLEVENLKMENHILKTKLIRTTVNKNVVVEKFKQTMEVKCPVK